jgi:hypothetical protein
MSKREGAVYLAIARWFVGTAAVLGWVNIKDFEWLLTGQ